MPENELKNILKQILKLFIPIPVILIAIGLFIFSITSEYSDANNMGIVSQPSNATLFIFILFNFGAVFIIGGILYLKLNSIKGDWK